MAHVDSMPLGHPGPMSQQNTDELDKQLDWLIENNGRGDDGQIYSPHESSGSTTPRSPGKVDLMSGDGDASSQQNKNLKPIETKYAPSSQSDSIKSSPPSSPSHVHYDTSNNKLESDDNDGLLLQEPLSVSNENSELKKSSDDEDDNDYNEDDYVFSEDQKQALMELQDMKIDLGYTEEEPPEYDVTERVRQLNEELANDPTPGLEDSRHRAIKFPENVVSLEIPPIDYAESEESDENKGQNLNKSSTKTPENSSTTTSNTTHSSNNMEVEMDTNSQQNSLVKPEYSNEDKDESTTPAQQKSLSTKTEIGDEVVDSESDDELIKDDDGKSNSSLSDEPHTVDEEQKQRHSRPKSSHPTAMRMRFKQIGVEIKKVEKEPEKHSDIDENKENEDKEDEKVLVERNGKFDLLKASDLTPEERQLHGIETEEDKKVLQQQKETNDNESVKSESSKTSSSSNRHKEHVPHPPRAPRPYTATHTGKQHQPSGKQRRVQSAKADEQQQSDYDFQFDYTSPYAMDPEEKKKVQREESERRKKQKQEDDEKRERKKRDQEDAEEAFKAWLNAKRQEAQRRRQQENEEKKKQKEREENEDENDDRSEVSKRDPDSAYKEWCQVKRDQGKKNKKVEEARKREEESIYVARSRKVCNKAFNEWLKKKNSDLRRQKLEELQKHRVARLLSRRSRKSQQLARAMTHANNFKYVDYYGYRC